MVQVEETLPVFTLQKFCVKSNDSKQLLITEIVKYRRVKAGTPFARVKPAPGSHPALF